MLLFAISISCLQASILMDNLIKDILSSKESLISNRNNVTEINITKVDDKTKTTMEKKTILDPSRRIYKFNDYIFYKEDNKYRIESNTHNDTSNVLTLLSNNKEATKEVENIFGEIKVFKKKLEEHKFGNASLHHELGTGIRDILGEDQTIKTKFTRISRFMKLKKKLSKTSGSGHIIKDMKWIKDSETDTTVIKNKYIRLGSNKKKLCTINIEIDDTDGALEFTAECFELKDGRYIIPTNSDVIRISKYTPRQEDNWWTKTLCYTKRFFEYIGRGLKKYIFRRNVDRSQDDYKIDISGSKYIIVEKDQKSFSMCHGDDVYKPTAIVTGHKREKVMLFKTIDINSITINIK